MFNLLISVIPDEAAQGFIHQEVVSQCGLDSISAKCCSMKRLPLLFANFRQDVVYHEAISGETGTLTEKRLCC